MLFNLNIKTLGGFCYYIVSLYEEMKQSTHAHWSIKPQNKEHAMYYLNTCILNAPRYVTLLTTVVFLNGKA